MGNSNDEDEEELPFPLPFPVDENEVDSNCIGNKICGTDSLLILRKFQSADNRSFCCVENSAWDLKELWIRICVLP